MDILRNDDGRATVVRLHRVVSAQKKKGTLSRRRFTPGSICDLLLSPIYILMPCTVFLQNSDRDADKPNQRQISPMLRYFRILYSIRLLSDERITKTRVNGMIRIFGTRVARVPRDCTRRRGATGFPVIHFFLHISPATTRALACARAISDAAAIEPRDLETRRIAR